MLSLFELRTTPYIKNLAALKSMSIICMARSLSLKGIGGIWPLNLVCLLMRIKTF